MPAFWYPITEGTRRGTKKLSNRLGTRGHLNEEIRFTKIGFVYCYVKAHGKKVGPNCKMNPVSPELHPASYYCHFHAVYNGVEHKAHVLKECYGENHSPLGPMAREFAERVQAHAEERDTKLPPLRDKDLIKENLTLKLTLNALTEVMLSWMHGRFMRGGLTFPTFNSYPLPLQRALTILGKEDK